MYTCVINDEYLRLIIFSTSYHYECNNDNGAFQMLQYNTNNATWFADALNTEVLGAFRIRLRALKSKSSEMVTCA